MTKRKRNSAKNKWITCSEKLIVDSPVMQVIRKNCMSSEDSRQHRFYLLKSRDWCNIIPVTEDGKIVLVKQHRIGSGEHTYEIPGGVAEKSEKDTRKTAIREMIEETGYVPLAQAKCVSLGWTYPNPAIQDNRCHSYVIGPVNKQKKQKLDPGEMIDVVEVPINKLAEWIKKRKINHALILNAFFFLLMNPKLSPKSRKKQDLLASILKKFTR